MSNKIKNYYSSRVFILVLYTVILFLGFIKLNREFSNPNDLFLFSSLLILTINTLIVEHFFETPKDVINATLNALLLLITFYNQEPKLLWNGITIYLLLILTCAVLSAVLYNYKANERFIFNRISTVLKCVSVFFGKSIFIFPAIILSALYTIYHQDEISLAKIKAFNSDIQYILAIVSYTVIVLIPFVKNFFISIADWLYDKIATIFKKDLDAVGEMVAVQSNAVFIIELYNMDKRAELHIFDVVEFKYGIENILIRGYIIDFYNLDNQQKVKILKLPPIDEKDIKNNLPNNIVYKVDPTEDEKKRIKQIAGTVVEGSSISDIKFEYSSSTSIKEGSLLYVTQHKDSVLYQITQATTDIKSFEKNNQSGLIIANATQLGIWKKETRNFEKYGWVPEMNSPVSIATDIEGAEVVQNKEILIGNIENTKFNIIVNIEDLITHHTAVLGTTGTGKSVFSRNIIKQLAEDNHKIFCIDLTGEIKQKLQTQDLIDLRTPIVTDPIELTDKKNNIICIVSGNIGDYIKAIVKYRGYDFGNDLQNFNELSSTVEKYISTELQKFINLTDHHIGVLEFSQLSNTEETLELTKFFFKVLFGLAKKGNFRSKSACIVLEEAHTLIPEWNFVGGSDDKTARRLTNTIAQIALQGRKYNLGLLVIAQRTANVSKTILTQCNTIISFKQFDNTSRDFLTNYYGNSLSGLLFTLKHRNAIIAGKALISDVPLIFRVPDINE